MVVVGLKSAGLGNCMFQYAAARALAIEMKSSLKLDISGLREQQMPFRRYTDRDVMRMLAQSLGVFEIQYEIASKGEVQKLRGWGDERLFLNKIIKKFRYKFNFFPPTLFREKLRYGYDSSIFEVRSDVYLDGFFINPRYFQKIHAVLEKDFVFKNEQIKENLSFSREISVSNSVSIHVRRGDFADAKSTGNIYPVYGQDYYKKAVRLICEKVAKPKFYIFSDDIEWATDNLDFIENSVIVSHNSIDNGAEDLRLMSQCKHNVITNSTFSWWAAWLNRNSEKIVVCPEKWRNDSVDTAGMLANDWIVIR
jgi:hypothetical protein